MKEIKKVEEDFWIQKERRGWNRVYPVKKNLDEPFSLKNIHWKHLLIGSYSRLVWTVIILILIYGLLWSYAHDTKECRNLVENKTMRCRGCYDIGYSEISVLDNIWKDWEKEAEDEVSNNVFVLP